MKKVIIFEGLDRCGKTSIINELEKKLLAKKWNPRIWSFKKPETPILQKYQKIGREITDWIKADKRNIAILDRSPLGEWVWNSYRSNINNRGKYLIKHLLDPRNKIWSELIFKQSEIFILYDEIETLLKRDDGQSLPQNVFNWTIAKYKFRMLYYWLNSQAEKRQAGFFLLNSLHWLKVDKPLSEIKDFCFSEIFWTKLKPKEIKFYKTVCKEIGFLSNAQRQKVGALIVNDETKNIESYGYNGTPSGWPNRCEIDGKTLPEVLHAETNAISKQVRDGSSTLNRLMFIKLSPCTECFKLIIQSGIKALWIKDLYRQTDHLLSWATKTKIKFYAWDLND